MAKKAYSREELATIMTEVTQAVDEVLAKSQAPVTTVVKSEGASVQDAQEKKAQGGQMTKADEDPAQSAEPSPSPSPSPDAGSPPPDASAPASPSPDAGADPMGAGGAPTMEELKAAYDQLSPDEKALHMQALQASMQASSAAPAPGPDATAPMPGDQSQGVSPEFAMKSEKLQAQIEDLKKSLSVAVDALALVVSQPKPKSIAGEDMILKGEPSLDVEALSKNEVTERLNKAVRSETLTKSDRELVKGFYNGQRTRNDIAHLLK